jgi:hypothetical protein
MVSNVEDA